MKFTVFLMMFGLPIAVTVLLATIIATDIHYSIKSKKQNKRFAELYKMCIDKHGLAFAQKVYEGCTKPLWIGMDRMIAVFEHHCGIESELAKKS